MLTAAEKRFIKSWEEQRQGGKVKYYLLYILVGTFPAILVLSFLASIFGFFHKLWITITLSFIIVTIATIRAWAANERKFKGIIQREVNEAKLRDEAQEGEGS